MDARWIAGVVAAMLGLGGVAHAQDGAPGAGPDPTPEDAATDLYPTELHLRPLVLPAGVVELGGRLRTLSYGGDSGFTPDDYNPVYADLSARGGLGPVELFAQVDLLVDSPYDDAEAFDRASGGVAAPVGDGAVTGGLTVYAPTSDFSAYEPFAAYTMRRRASETVSVDLGGGARYYRYSYNDTSYGYAQVEGIARGQVQIAPSMGVTGGVRLSIPFAESESLSEGFGPGISTTFDGRVVYTAPMIDVYVGLEVASYRFGSVRQLFAGVTGRLP